AAFSFSPLGLSSGSIGRVALVRLVVCSSLGAISGALGAPSWMSWSIGCAGAPPALEPGPPSAGTRLGGTSGTLPWPPESLSASAGEPGLVSGTCPAACRSASLVGTVSGPAGVWSRKSPGWIGSYCTALPLAEAGAQNALAVPFVGKVCQSLAQAIELLTLRIAIARELSDLACRREAEPPVVDSVEAVGARVHYPRDPAKLVSHRTHLLAGRRTGRPGVLVEV